jgi:hypothetical protein
MASAAALSESAIASLPISPRSADYLGGCERLIAFFLKVVEAIYTHAREAREHPPPPPLRGSARILVRGISAVLVGYWRGPKGQAQRGEDQRTRP